MHQPTQYFAIAKFHKRFLLTITIIFLYLIRVFLDLDRFERETNTASKFYLLKVQFHKSAFPRQAVHSLPGNFEDLRKLFS